MGWLRLHRGWSGGLALFALALQLVLSFGHIHLDDIAARPAAIAALAQPADSPDHDEDAAKHCDICATLHSLGTAQLPVPPALMLPVAFAVAPAAIRSDAVIARTRHDSFRARAPPLA
jgi:hypothetical protein